MENEKQETENSAPKLTGKKARGFASMSPERRAEVSRLGGITAHQKGTAHEFTTEEARAAGKLGGKASGQVRAKRAA